MGPGENSCGEVQVNKVEGNKNLGIIEVFISPNYNNKSSRSFVFAVAQQKNIGTIII